MLAAYLTPTQAARQKALWVGGLDVFLDPIAQAYGVPIESVNVTAAGPGGVSRMTFTINDPGRVVAVGLYMPVLFYDHVLDYPIFAGYVTSYSYVPDFGQQGRAIAVSAVGSEAILDWALMRMDLTIPVLTTAPAAFQSIFNNAAGVGPLRAFSGQFDDGTQALPIGQLNIGCILGTAVTVTAGTTLREALRSLAGALYGTAALPFPFVVDVDFYFGLRIWNDGATHSPSDYSTEVITETGANKAEFLEYAVDGTDSAIAVFVLPGVAANAVLVQNVLGPPGYTPGPGQPGPQPVLPDPVSADQAAAAAVGAAYLAQFNVAVRGSYQQLDRAASSTVHPGSIATITNSEVSLAASSFRIAQIDRTFNKAGREDWTVSYGGMPPSLVRLVRRLTLEARA